MPKINRFGKATVLSPVDVDKIVKASTHKAHNLAFLIGIYTGERIGAILQLEVWNVYENPYKSVPRQFITYPASTRKKSPDGTAKTREVPISKNLEVTLRNYDPPKDGFLFPNPQRPGEHLKYDAFGKWLSRTCIKAGLGRRGITSHSMRRSLVTNLAAQGVPIPVIQKITGHSNLRNVQEYVDVDPQMIRKSLELL